MAASKIQSGIQLTIRPGGGEPLALQIVHQVLGLIDAGHVRPGTRLPSSRELARTLGVSRNTVLAAYEELIARGFVRSRRGAAMYADAPVGVPALDLHHVMRDAQYPVRAIAFHDRDGNPIYVT
ncbi:MAG: GntR family transcriptional regulator [Vicinamibacterales bacterium]